MKQESMTLAECLCELVGRSCWSKLFSRDPNDHRRMKSIQDGVKATWKHARKLEEYAKRKGDHELLAILDERFPVTDESA